MAWLARLDARAQRAPWFLPYLYLTLKWTLVALGVYGVAALAVIEIRERRVGLGTGVLTFVLWTYTPRAWRLLTGRRP